MSLFLALKFYKVIYEKPSKIEPLMMCFDNKQIIQLLVKVITSFKPKKFIVMSKCLFDKSIHFQNYRVSMHGQEPNMR